MSKTNFAYKKQLLTDDDYLRIEREAFEKSEFIKGRIVAVASASENHNVISSNVFGEMAKYGHKLKIQIVAPFRVICESKRKREIISLI